MCHHFLAPSSSESNLDLTDSSSVSKFVLFFPDCSFVAVIQIWESFQVGANPKKTNFVQIYKVVSGRINSLRLKIMSGIRVKNIYPLFEWPGIQTAYPTIWVLDLYSDAFKLKTAQSS